MRAAPRFPCRNDGDIAGTPHDAATVTSHRTSRNTANQKPLIASIGRREFWKTAVRTKDGFVDGHIGLVLARVCAALGEFAGRYTNLVAA